MRKTNCLLVGLNQSFISLYILYADLGPLGNYPGSPFLPSDSDILLDSPEQEDIGRPIFIFSSLINFFAMNEIFISFKDCTGS